MKKESLGEETNRQEDEAIISMGHMKICRIELNLNYSSRLNAIKCKFG